MKMKRKRSNCRICDSDAEYRYCRDCLPWGILQEKQQFLDLVSQDPDISAKEAASKLNIPLHRAYRLAKSLDIRFKNPLINQKLRDFVRGYGNYAWGDLSEMARELGISRERIRQIANQEKLLPFCPVCGEQLPTRRMKLHRKCRKLLQRDRALRLCCICGKVLGRGQKILCSDECRKRYYKKGG